MSLYHFSEDPSIKRFVPHRAPTSNRDDELVWAIDEWHAPMYWFPRDCPRACFWPGAATTAEDRDRWFAGSAPRMVIAVESAWLERIRGTTLYCYTMPELTFELADRIAGHHISRVPVAPLSVVPMGDLLEALLSAEVELRVTPRLGALWTAVIGSSLEFSGTRLRNAQDWPFGQP